MTSLVKAIQERLAKICDEESARFADDKISTGIDYADKCARHIRAADLSDLEPKEGESERLAAIRNKLAGAHEALLFLVELKTMKRKIEAGTATEEQVSFYLAHKEDAWAFAEAVIEMDITHERV